MRIVMAAVMVLALTMCRHDGPRPAGTEDAAIPRAGARVVVFIAMDNHDGIQFPFVAFDDGSVYHWRSDMRPSERWYVRLTSAQRDAFVASLAPELLDASPRLPSSLGCSHCDVWLGIRGEDGRWILRNVEGGPNEPEPIKRAVERIDAFDHPDATLWRPNATDALYESSWYEAAYEAWSTAQNDARASAPAT